MSHSNVETVRRIYEAFCDRDLTAALEHMDEGIEWVVSPSTSVEPAIFTGHEGVLQDAERFQGAWREITVELESLIDIEPYVVAYSRWTGTAKSADLQVAMHLGALWTLENDKVVRFEHFPTGDAALDSLGLDPLRRRSAVRQRSQG